MAERRTIRRRGRSGLWGSDPDTGKANKPEQSWNAMLQDRFKMELGAVSGLESQAKRSLKDYHGQNLAQTHQSNIDRGMTGSRAANFEKRAAGHDLARGYEDIAARLAPLYATILQSQRGAMSELYRNEFDLLTMQETGGTDWASVMGNVAQLGGSYLGGEAGGDAARQLSGDMYGSGGGVSMGMGGGKSMGAKRV